MAMLEVACPGCSTKLKAPDTSAGKKAKCKKCGTAFRLPGNPVSTAGDAQMLSAVDAPAAEPNPFAFDALLAPPPPPPAPPKPAVKPLAATPEPAASDDPFNFGSFAAPEPPAPPPPPAPAAKKSTPKAAPLPEPKPNAKARPKPAPAPALDPFADVPEAEPVQEILSLDDDEPAPAPAASGDPFAFSSQPMPAPRAQAEARPARAGEEAPPEDTHRGGYRRAPQKSKAPLIAALLGLVALGAAVAVVVVVVTKKKDEPQAEAKDRKKDEKKEPEAAPENKDDTNKDKEETRRDARASGKGGKGKTGTGKKFDPRATGPTVVRTPPEPGGKGEGRSLLAFNDATRTIRFNPPAADAAPVKAAERRPLDLAIPSIKLAFPPHNKGTSDTVFVVQLSAGFQGQGEKLALERFSPVGMKRGDRLEFPGDGKPVPACDVTADTDLFAHAIDGKLTVWKLADKSKVVDAWDVFAEMPEHKKAGIAAVYFVTPETVATITTAGAVHAWELASKKKLGEFVPPKATPGKVLAGKSVARTADRAIVVVAVGGTIYQVGVKGAVGPVEGTVELGGDVGRSLGLAVSGNGKLLYVFETAPEAREDKKKERIVAALPGGGRQPTYLRWPEGVGEPESAGWANDEIAVVGTDKGRAFWFELSEGRFVTLALLVPPGELGRHAAGEAGHWAVLPDPTLPGKAVLQEYAMPPEGYLELQEATTGGKPAPTLKLDPKGGGA